MPGITKSLYRESTPVTKSNYRGSPKAAQETRFLVPGALERVLAKKSSDSKTVIPSILLKPSPKGKGSIQVNNAYETLGIAYPATPGQRSNYRESPIDHRSNYRESPGQRSNYRKPLGPGSNYTGGSKDKYHDGTSQSLSPSKSKDRRDDKSYYRSGSSYRQSSRNNYSGLESGYHSPRSNRPPNSYGSSGRDSYYHRRDDSGCCGCSRCVCISIICAVFLMLAIIAVLVVVFWYFLFRIHATSTTISSIISTAEPVEDKAHFFKNVCIEKKLMKKKQVSQEECVAGSPPTKESCSEESSCFFYTYEVSKSGEKYRLAASVESVKMPLTSINQMPDQSRLLCVMNDDALGMCEHEQCSLPYKGKYQEEWKNVETNSEWEENCNKPNPCWDSPSLIDEYATKDMVTRDKCLSTTAGIDCPNTEADVGLWVQHLRCKHGKHETTYEKCKDNPVKIWNCGNCKNSNPKPPDGCSRRQQSCEYNCTGVPAKRTAMNGVWCKTTKSGPMYCVHGECKDAEKISDELKKVYKKNCGKNL